MKREKLEIKPVLGKKTLIDASDLIVGRLSANVAKRLLAGEEVTVINAEKAAISGYPKAIHKMYVERKKLGSSKKGPYFPKYPDMFVRRVIRGMLPWHNTRGRNAFKRLRVYMGQPKEITGKFLNEGKKSENLTCKHTTVGDLCKSLGAKL